MRRGDVITIRIMDSKKVAEPVTRKTTDPSIDTEQERAYYEHPRRKYDPEKSLLRRVRRSNGSQLAVVAGPLVA